MSDALYRHHFTKQSFDWIVELYEDRIDFYNGEGTRLYESVPYANIVGVDYDEVEGFGGSLRLHKTDKESADFSFDECDKEIAQEYVSVLLEHIPRYNPVFVLSVNDDCEVKYRENYFDTGRPDFYVNIFGYVEIFAIYDEKFTVATKNCYFDRGDTIAYSELTDLSFQEKAVSDTYSHFVLSFTHGEKHYEIPVSDKNLSEMRALFKVLGQKVRQFAKNEERKEIFTVTDSNGSIYEFEEDHILSHYKMPGGEFHDRIITYDDIEVYEVRQFDELTRCSFYKKEKLEFQFSVDAGIEAVQTVERFTHRKLMSVDEYITSIYGERGELIEEACYTRFYENYCVLTHGKHQVIPYANVNCINREKCTVNLFSRVFDRYAAYFADWKVVVRCIKDGERYGGAYEDFGIYQKKFIRKLRKMADKWHAKYYLNDRGRVSYIADGKRRALPKNTYFLRYLNTVLELLDDELVICGAGGEKAVEHCPYKKITKATIERDVYPRRGKYLIIRQGYQNELKMYIDGMRDMAACKKILRKIKKRMKK